MLKFGLRMWILAFLIIWTGGIGAAWPQATVVGVPGSPIPESPDFATLALHDAWDMNQYSDVSQYLNESGQRNLVANPTVANGQFTGQSVGDANTGNAYFFPLFPGYETTMLIGKVGHRYPIDSAAYHCLYIAMKVDSPVHPPLNPDQFRIFWFADERLNTGGATWGQTSGIQLYPGNEGLPRYYRIYKVDLAAPPNGSFGAKWNDSPTWQGLRIDPTINAGVTFAVDWVRLTSCSANSQPITWYPDGSINSAWVNAAGANRWIRVASGLNGSGGSASLDVQGLPPGSYTVGLGNATTCCQQTSSAPMVIDSAPIVDFVSPSFFSGADYPSQAGAAWDFSSAISVNHTVNMSYSIHNGVLETTVPSGPAPAGVDAQVFLNTPQPIQPATYRYLSFRMYTDWKAPWQNVPQGMIVRVIWGIQGVSGAPTNRCWLSSQDIPFDIGWQTYWIDLGDAFNGKPELTSVSDCPSTTPNWINSPPVLNFRFDPDENITAGYDPITGGGPFHHQIDWIRLTAIDHVSSGTPYLIQLHLSRSLSQITYFYTTNRADPTQAAAQSYSPGLPAAGANRIWLPVMQAFVHINDLGGLPASNATFSWDTSGVSPNSYYICVRVTGGGNTTTTCSEAPVIVS